MIYSSYLGGGDNDEGGAVAVDNSGNAYVVGDTVSLNFPTKNSYQSAMAGGVGIGDAFVTVLNTNLSGAQSLVYSTYLGGSSSDRANTVALDSVGNLYVGGYTHSGDFPRKAGLFNSYGSAWIAKLNPSLTGDASLLWSSLFGGGGSAVIMNLALDASGNVWFTGNTSSTYFPVTSATAFQPACAINPSGPQICSDAFVSELNSDGNTLLYSTYLGGTDYDVGEAISLKTPGRVYVAGTTLSSDFPMTNAFQPSSGGAHDVFVVGLNPAIAGSGALIYSSYLGGSGDDWLRGMIADTKGNVSVAGYTASYDFPITAGSLQSSFGGGGYDGFVAKVFDDTVDVTRQR
jgi:hypothetical protein